MELMREQTVLAKTAQPSVNGLVFNPKWFPRFFVRSGVVDGWALKSNEYWAIRWLQRGDSSPFAPCRRTVGALREAVERGGRGARVVPTRSGWQIEVRVAESDASFFVRQIWRRAPVGDQPRSAGFMARGTETSHQQIHYLSPRISVFIRGMETPAPAASSDTLQLCRKHHHSGVV